MATVNLYKPGNESIWNVNIELQRYYGPGGDQGVLVQGAWQNELNGVYKPIGEFNGKRLYERNGVFIFWWDNASAWDLGGGGWVLGSDTIFSSVGKYYRIEEDVEFPYQASGLESWNYFEILQGPPNIIMDINNIPELLDYEDGFIIEEFDDLTSEWVEVPESNINSISYDSNTSILKVEFNPIGSNFDWRPVIDEEYLFNPSMSKSFIQTEFGEQISLVLSTDIIRNNGQRFPTYIINNSNDTPPNHTGQANDFNELINLWIEFFMGGISNAIIGEAIIGEAIIE